MEPANADGSRFALNPGSLSRKVRQWILDDLTALVIQPGERITMDGLARRYEVSQTPIREALVSLEADGLVAKHHLRGFRATPKLTVEQFARISEVRVLLEPAAAALAASNRELDDVASLRSMLEEMRSATSSGDYGQFALLDSRFHDAIAKASGNDFLRSSISRLYVHLHLFRVRRDDMRVSEGAYEEHSKIVAAIRDNDSAVAAEAMKKHIENSQARLVDTRP